MSRPKNVWVTVDYSRTIEALVVAGSYQEIDPKINGRNFFKVDERGIIQRVEVGFFDLCFGELRPSDINHMIRNVHHNPPRDPVNIKEFLSLGAQHPDLQFGESIIASDCRYEYEGEMHTGLFFPFLGSVPAESGKGKNRVLGLEELPYGFEFCGGWFPYVVGRKS